MTTDGGFSAPEGWVLRAPALPGTRHGFFTRLGGVSAAPYASLNCSARSGDDPDAIRENRRRVAVEIGVAPEMLLGVSQVHSADAVIVDEPWAFGEGAKADAMVTTRPDAALGVITADCAPVLFASRDGRVVGAAHAGWRGAVGGVLEATLRAMEACGARTSDVVAVVGPCITSGSYEVGEDMRAAVLQDGDDAEAAQWFAPGVRDGHYQFDLAGYCQWRLRAAGVGEALALGVDTLSDERRFYSHRRRTLAGGGHIGHQISVIAPTQHGGAV